jgi:hypothetical protein
MRKNSIKTRHFNVDVTNLCKYKIAKELCLVQRRYTAEKPDNVTYTFGEVMGVCRWKAINPNLIRDINSLL